MLRITCLNSIRWTSISTRSFPVIKLQLQEGIPNLQNGLNFPIRTYAQQMKPRAARKRRRALLIGLSLFGAGLAYGVYRSKQAKVRHPAREWQISLYRFLPWKSLSRFWGYINTIDLPVFLRKPILGLYAKLFNCKLEEAEVEDLEQYSNLQEFFRRRLKDGMRPIHPSLIVSPADGRILHFGRIDCGQIEQIKGITYSIAEFLGAPTWLKDPAIEVELKECQDESTQLLIPTDHASDPVLLTDCAKYHDFLLTNKTKSNTALYHFVIYLAPGDYHCFHAPTDWEILYRRHFAGDLLSVNPEICALVRGLFNINERAVYMGRWKHGFFSMAAIGATNVGSIKIYEDDDLQTNVIKIPHGSQFERQFHQPLVIKKGDIFGEFNLGSTIVLIFEAPADLKFCVQPGQPIRVGQPILADSKN